MAQHKIGVLIDLAVDKANASIKGFREQLSETDSRLGKLKVAGGAAFDFVKQHAAELAIGAGASLVAFGKQAIDQFNELAIEVGKFADATGLAAEDASRWVEVAGDIGIEAPILEKAFGKLAREIGNGSAELEKYGIKAVEASDGTTDMNGTVLAAIDTIKKIEDPTKRAAAGQAAFGRGWQEMAELINMSAEDIVANLEAVSDQKVINDEEVRKAREYRASMDRLSDAIEDVQLEIGQKLVPAIGDATEGIAAMVETANRLKILDMAAEFWRWTTPLGLYGQITSRLGKSLDDLRDDEVALRAELEQAGFTREKVNEIVNKHIHGLEGEAAATTNMIELQADEEEAAKRAAREQERHTAAVERSKREVERSADALKQWNDRAREQYERTQDLISAKSTLVGGDIAVREAQRQAAEAVEAYNEAVKEGKEGTELYGAATDEAARSVLDAAAQIANIRIEQREANGEQLTAAERAEEQRRALQQLATELDPSGALMRQLGIYVQTLRDIPREISTTVRVNQQGVRVGGGGSQQRNATGTPFSGSEFLAGENGPEIVRVPAGSVVEPAWRTDEISRRGGMVPTIVHNTYNSNTHIHHPRREVMDEIALWRKRNGPTENMRPLA